MCEDDAAIRTLLLTLLSRDGFAVDIATNGREGIDAVSAADYSLVILDLMMPKASGYDVLAQIEATNPALLSRVIVLTAAATAGRGDFPYAVATVMIKPFDVLELAALARNVATQRAAS